MPELPEVETMRRGLIKTVLNKKIVQVQVLKPKIVSGNGTTRVANNTKTKEFEEGLKNQIILVHLKMTGQFTFHPNLDDFEPSKHACIVFYLEDSVLVYQDIRQFGYMLFYSNLDSLKASKEWKSDFYDGFLDKLESEKLYPIIHKSSKSIKKLMLDQTPIGGIGNIYADEICFESKIKPTRICKELSKIEVKTILDNTFKILSKAVEVGGSSISDYKKIDGTKGDFKQFHNVYGRGLKECFVCKNILEKTQEAGRTTVYCNTCQK
jgi:formamidopyrimidine-DNA glycosylase